MRMKETKHVKAFKQNKQKPGEEAIIWLDGYISDGAHSGALIITDTRAVFYRKGIFGEVYENIPLNKITSVEVKSFFGHRTMTLHTSHDDLCFKSYEAKELVNDVQQRIESVRDGASTSSEPDSIDTLRKLSELRDAGILSEDEFNAKKSEVLGKI